MILSTKLTLPKKKDELLPRPRIVRELEKNLNRRIIVICADAGFGKTTVLVQLLSSLKSPHLYYQVDEKDRDLAVFLTYLSSGLTQLYHDFGTKAVESFRQTRSIETSAVTLVNDIVSQIGRPIYLVFDDYHHISNCRDINRFMDFVLSHGPDFLHFIISTRVHPPLSLTDLIAKQEFFEMGRDRLRFAREEIDQLFRKLSEINLSQQELTRLEEHSEGWITALRLIIQDLQTKPQENTGDLLNSYLRSGESLFDFFANEILLREEPRIRTFLLASSILDQMDAKNCQFVLGTRNPNRVLVYLAQKHLFVTRVDATAFQYHRLFKEFLKNRLTTERGAAAVRSLHYRAGRYYQRENAPLQAVEHLIAGERYEEAMGLINKSASDFLGRGMFSILNSWIERLPTHCLKRDIDICFIRAKILRLWGRWDEAIEILTDAYRAYRSRRRNTDCALVLNEMALIYHYRGNSRKALSTARRGSRYVPDRNHLLLVKTYHTIAVILQAVGQLVGAERYMLKARRISRQKLKAEGSVQIDCGLAFIYSARGEFIKAAEILKTVIEEHEARALLLPWMGNVYGNAASIAMDLGRFDEAGGYLERAEEICRRFNDRRSLIYLLGARGQYHFCQTEYERATRYYERAIEENRTLKERKIDFVAHADLGATYLARGNLVLAKRLCNQARVFINPGIISIDSLTLGMLEGQVELRAGNSAGALRTFRKALKNARRLRVTFFEARILFYLAQALIQKGNEREAARVIDELLRISERKGYEFFLVSETKKDHRVIEFALKKKLNPAYVEVLTKMIDPGVFGKSKQTDQAGRIRVKLFGGLHLVDARGEALAMDWPSQKAKSLFGYFILHPSKRFVKDHLIEIFWPEKPRDKGEQNLYTNISILKKLFKKKTGLEIILHKEQFYFLNPDLTIDSDFSELDHLIGMTKTEKDRAALTGHQRRIAGFDPDEFLPEINDTWTVTTKDFINQAYIKSLKHLAAACLADKDHDRGLEYLQRVIKLDSFDEEAHAGIMECFAMLGRQKLLVEHYESFARAVRKELHREPTREISALYHELAKQGSS